jgi:phosphatidate phosphatase PAH1
MRWLAWLLAGCAGTASDDTAPACTAAIVTDIDETLTTSDFEFLSQLTDGAYDPAMRPDADRLMQGYDDLGFAVVYVTGRGEDITLDDGRTAREATRDWLALHGFPIDDEALLFLAPGIGANGDAAREYKGGVLQGLQADGYRFSYGYGNAEADIQAYQDSGMPDDVLFLVGELAGTMTVNAVPDEEAYSAHLTTFLPTVGPAPACAD